MAKKKASRESLVVASKVREFVKGKKCFASGDLLDGLNQQVSCLLTNAVERAKQNKRKTVRGHDI
jgi:histone H3/H4